MKPSIAVHKFSSCDGCQLAFLNLGEDLLTLFQQVDVRHFAEAGPVDASAEVDISFVEGSITTPDEIERIREVRNNSKYVVTIGACAVAGGLQALRNLGDSGEWMAAIYASPEYIATLDSVAPVSEYIKVDRELWGCPVNSRQLLAAIGSLLAGVVPRAEADSICLECKRQGQACVMVARGVPCMGPVTRSGCGALCPGLDRGCYGCYGPCEKPPTEVLAHWFAGLGLTPEQIAQRFLAFTPEAPAFYAAGRSRLTSDD
jgi:coenzyme F420-reducing hydrogenase gamma subunit